MIVVVHLHQITAKTDVITKLRKGKTKAKDKKQHSEPEVNTTSDEDNSLECKAALSSLVNGIAARNANEVSSNQYLTPVL